MEQTWQQLFAFVDHKDPFMPAEIAEEELPGPILSILGARAFNRVHLFHTPQLAPAADSTDGAIRTRWPQCRAPNSGSAGEPTCSKVAGSTPGNVKEVRLDRADWSSLRDLVMPQEYLLASEAEDQPQYSRAFIAVSVPPASRHVTP